MRVLILNGPNLNMLGVRETNVYGTKTYKDLVSYLKANAKDFKVTIKQSNYEGKLIDWILKLKYDYLIINAGGLTHTSISLRDAIAARNIKAISVHLTNIYEREEFRKTNYLKDVCVNEFVGDGFLSYLKAYEYISKDCQ